MNTQANKKSRMGWILMAIIGAAVAAGVFIALYLFAPSGYLGLDVNPGIDIRTNRLGQVVSVEPANEDAEKLLAGYTLRDRDLDDVVEELVDRMIIGGYITAEGPNDVLISVDSDEVPAATLEQVNEKIAAYVATQEMKVNVMSQSIDVDRQLQSQADRAGLSPGRMALVDSLLADGDLSLDELAGMTVSDLLEYARKNNIPLDQLEDWVDDAEDLYGDDALDHLEEGLDDLEDAAEPHDDDLDDHYNAPPAGNSRQTPPAQSAPVGTPPPAPVPGYDHDDWNDWDDYDDWDDDGSDDWDDDDQDGDWDDHDDDWDDDDDD